MQYIGTTMIKTIIFSVTLIVTTIKLTAQQRDFEKISLALSVGENKNIVEYAPEENYGSMSFFLPNMDSEEQVLRSEFAKKIQTFFVEHPPKSFNLIRSGHDPNIGLPFASGNYTSKDGKVFYILMVFAKFGSAYRFTMFHVNDKQVGQE